MKTYKVEVDYYNTIRWYNEEGQRHREDGPAVEYASGTKSWWLNDQLHREDGPAVEYTNGDKYWYLNGKYHRVDGPAAEYANGDKVWYLNDKRLTEAEFNKRMQKKSSCEGKVVEIEGKKYKLLAI